MKALKDGERKFWMNQNLTVLLVCRITDTIMRKAMRWKRAGLIVKMSGQEPADGAHLVKQARSDSEDIDVGTLPGGRNSVILLRPKEREPADQSLSRV
jgi:hypothetical protein